MPPTCQCACHRTEYGNFAAAFHAGKWDTALRIADTKYFELPASVLADDALEAAVSCDECRYRHCAALLDPPKPLPRKRPPPPPFSPQADGDDDGS